MTSILSQIVEVYIFRFKSTRPEYLVLRRSPGESLYPGMWQIVTGTRHDGEKPVDAALRELREETGLGPVRLWSVPHVDVFYDRIADAIQLSPMFAVEVGDGAEPRLSSEHDACEWLPADSARNRMAWPAHRTGLEIVERFIAGGETAMYLCRIPLDPP